MKKKKPAVGLEETLEASVRARVVKTGKTYHRTRLFARHVIKSPFGEREKTVDEYYLRKGRGWRQVSVEEFAEATSEEAQKQLHKQLEQELQARLEAMVED